MKSVSEGDVSAKARSRAALVTRTSKAAIHRSELRKRWDTTFARYFIPLASRKNKVADTSFAIGLPSSHSPFSYEDYESPNFETIHITRENILCVLDKDFTSHASFYHRLIIEDKNKELDGFSGGGIFTLERNRNIVNPEWEVFLDGIITRGKNGFIYYICWN